jgi:hypothetical protein
MNIPLKEYTKRSSEIKIYMENSCSQISEDEYKELQMEMIVMMEYLHNTYIKISQDYTKLKKMRYNTVKNNQTTIINSCDIINVQELVTIPPTKISWSPEINQYVIRIGKLVLRGNIGNIYNKHMINNPNINISQIVKCKQGINCKTIKASDCSNLCKFYHDPLELYIMLEAEEITQDFYKAQAFQSRNFSNTSWLYTNSPRKHDNKMMRKVGSLSTLQSDINMLKLIYNDEIADELETYKQQVIHDILVLLVLNENGLC